MPVARRLFARARTPAEVAGLTAGEIDELIHASSFHEAKAWQIRDIAVRARDEYGGVLPCDAAVLTSFHGVGPKCANLALGIACGHHSIGVDIHVHRVTNRWGYVQTTTPERTMAVLQEKLPRLYWVEINALLVPFPMAPVNTKNVHRTNFLLGHPYGTDFVYDEMMVAPGIGDIPRVTTEALATALNLLSRLAFWRR